MQLESWVWVPFFDRSLSASICRLHSLLLRARWKIPNWTKVEWTQVVLKLVYITIQRAQTNHVVDTPPTRQMLLVSCRKLLRKRKKISMRNWRDITQGVYNIIKVKDQGRHKIWSKSCVGIERKNRPTMFVWGPSSLAYALLKTQRTHFILNLGPKISETTDNHYFAFNLAWKQWNESVSFKHGIDDLTLFCHSLA